jgi:hypothetical protein
VITSPLVGLVESDRLLLWSSFCFSTRQRSVQNQIRGSQDGRYEDNFFGYDVPGRILPTFAKNLLSPYSASVNFYRLHIITSQNKDGELN